MSRTSDYLATLVGKPDADIPRLLNQIVLDAVDANASDIHIEPWEKALVIRIRVSGVLTELAHLPLEFMEKLSGRVKVLANLVSYVTDLPQEGHAPASPDFGNVELRVSTFPTVRGEKIVLRIFDPSNRSFDLPSLGFEDSTLHAIEKLLARPSGLLLFTGPTGAGKTTAIYASLCHLIQRSGPTVSIATVEDPVEFHLPMISQAQINPAKEFTYPVALRSLMRQDPEVIMIGEIRDPETAAIAVQAGLTGHLVISTTHSGSTAGVFARLLNMDIEPFLLASSVIGVLGLRLARKNCEYCAAPYDPEPGMLALLHERIREEASFRRGGGCDHCVHTGFSGRSAITEMMLVDEVMRDALLQKLPTRSLQDVAIKQGMTTLWQQALKRVCEGHTTLEEILRVIAMDE